jgi:hypothetical protein
VGQKHHNDGCEVCYSINALELFRQLRPCPTLIEKAGLPLERHTLSQPPPLFCDTCRICSVKRSRHYRDTSWICGPCPVAHTHSPPRMAQILFIRILPINSHFASSFGRFSNSLWARSFEFPSSCPWFRPAQLFITLRHTLYLCNIHPRQIFPILLYPLLSPLLGTDTYPPIADLGDIDTEPLVSGPRRSLSLLATPLLRRPSLSHVLFSHFAQFVQ